MKRILLLATLFAFAPVTFAQEEEKEEDKPVPEAKTWVTQHSATVGGRKIDYTVTAGTMLMTNDEDEPIALVGFTAYTKDGAGPRARAPSCSPTTAVRVRHRCGCTWEFLGHNAP